MNAGKLNRRIAVDEPVITQGDSGEQVTTWEEFAEVWGAIEPVRGREALVNSVNLSQMDTKIRLRWTPQLDVMTTEWRLRYKGLLYDIVSIVHVMTGKRELEVLCKSGANQG